MIVQLFHTCLVNEFNPGAGMAAVRVLERLGCEVRVPLAQTCCGQPAHNGGFRDGAVAAARHTIDLLEDTEGPVIVPSGSCGDMLVHQYAHLFDGDPVMRRRATALAARVREFSQFVAGLWPPRLAATLQGRVAYHPSCHLLRGLGVNAEPLALLSRIAGVTVTAIPEGEECCGFGGMFSIKHPAISADLLDRKLSNITTTGADRLVSCDQGCLLHLEGGLHRRGVAIRIEHLAELLDEALAG